VFPQSTEDESKMNERHWLSGVLWIKIFRKTYRMILLATTGPSVSIAVSIYLVLGFLMKPVFMKLGQRHVVLMPGLPKAASSSVKAL
jgi:hypothetical protein